MPLKYPSEWKFGEFEYEIPDQAHKEFIGLIELIAEGAVPQKSIYEEFKSAFGSSSYSSDTSWAYSDLMTEMRSLKNNAARYVAAFYSGMEAVKSETVDAPPVSKLNKILMDNGVPLVIRPPNLLLTVNADKVDGDGDEPVPVEFVRRGLEPSTVSSFVTAPISNKVFIVHGHDNEAKQEVARLLQKLKLEPIILHEQANKGQTIIEKFESNASDVAFAVILLTPDDVGAAKRDHKSLKERARENVVFEMGFFFAKLGRERVCALVKGGTEQPSDVSGVVYESMDSAGFWKSRLVKELQAAGMLVDLNDL